MARYAFFLTLIYRLRTNLMGVVTCHVVLTEVGQGAKKTVHNQNACFSILYSVLSVGFCKIKWLWSHQKIALPDHLIIIRAPFFCEALLVQVNRSVRNIKQQHLLYLIKISEKLPTKCYYVILENFKSFNRSCNSQS